MLLLSLAIQWVWWAIVMVLLALAGAAGKQVEPPALITISHCTPKIRNLPNQPGILLHDMRVSPSPFCCPPHQINTQNSNKLINNFFPLT